MSYCYELPYFNPGPGYANAFFGVSSTKSGPLPELKARPVPRLPKSTDSLDGERPALPTRLPLASDCAATSDARTEGSWSGTVARGARSATVQHTSAYVALYGWDDCWGRGGAAAQTWPTQETLLQRLECLKLRPAEVLSRPRLWFFLRCLTAPH